jgi:hypothetical protein
MSFHTTIPIYPFDGNGPVGGPAPPPFKGGELASILNQPNIVFKDGPTGTILSSPPKWGDQRLSADQNPYHGGIYVPQLNCIAFHGYQ